ncbi:alpha/beta fold hydrolase [uncultured Planococcus sp.]|uniref:alpha/beta hydrolase n=1 Tax=uncultured Planococcus sp. TaxID=337815 RepID=UPI0026185515|nr:alpha/beta fold hydrolase [uncultured Planococcus sp.]
MKKSVILYSVWAVLFLILQACSQQEDQEERVQMDELIGNWEGAIQVPGQALPIAVEFDGATGAISIPVQGIQGFPLSNFDFIDPDIHFEMSIQNQLLVFDGELSQDTIAGTFTQQGQSFPFELSRTAAAEEEAGTRAEIEVEGGGMTALILTPEGEGPFPVMLLLSGSGPTDKNGNSLITVGKNNSLKMVAEALAEEGIATIRYDKRGVGDNIGLMAKEEELRFEDYIKDASAWIGYAHSQERFSSIGVIGHSEGSLIGMIAAGQQQAASFVSLAGPGRPADEILMEQLKEQLPQNLLDEALGTISELKKGRTVEQVSPELASIFRPSVQPYLISWMAYDPRDELKKLDMPVLVVGGTTDLQVPIGDAELLEKAHDQAELLIVDNMNHVLKNTSTDPTENLASYGNPDLPLAEGLMEGILEFLK